MTDCLVHVCAEGTMRASTFFHFIQNAVGVKKIMNNLVLEYCNFACKWRPLTYYQQVKYRTCLTWNGMFATCESVCPPNTSHLVKLNVRPLTTGCESVYSVLKTVVENFLLKIWLSFLAFGAVTWKCILVTWLAWKIFSGVSFLIKV